MRLAHLALLFFCISLPMYFMGYQSPLMQLYDAQSHQLATPSTIINYIANNFLNLALLGLAAGVIFAVSALTGFSAVYAIPLLIVYAVFQFVLIPTSAVFNTSCGIGGLCAPNEVQVAGTVFLNLILWLAMIEFITGR